MLGLLSLAALLLLLACGGAMILGVKTRVSAS
jgi:hypothetical protein